MGLFACEFRGTEKAPMGDSGGMETSGASALSS